MIFSETRAEVSAAYTKAWGQITTPKHNQTVEVVTKSGGKYSFNFTDLAAIFEAIKKVLAENGIGVMQNAGTIFNEKDQPIVFVETLLLHSSGEYIQSERLQLVANHSIQDFGGQITYLKRYQLSAMMGLSTEADDDGNLAAGNQASQKPAGSNAGAPAGTKPKGATDKQKGMIRAKLKSISENMGIESDVLYEQIQKKFNTTTPIDGLNSMGASKIIEQLKKLEDGEVL